jgi:CO/xanthine dehydrogenase Mo-binding subunit
MVVSAAAKRWNVDPASCRAQSGEVLHAPTGRRVKYGELAAVRLMIRERPEGSFRRVAHARQRL